MGDKIWNDTNSNGIQDAGATGLSGVTVQLRVGWEMILSTNDLLNGNTGSDWLAGDMGDDTLTGGDGEDHFVYNTGTAFNTDLGMVYNSTNGRLFYNENGTDAGLGSGGQFATLTTLPAINANDFLLVA